MNASSTLPSDHPDFWRQRYQTQQTPWDLGSASPPLQWLCEQHPEWFTGHWLSVGCGRGHDAAYLAKRFPQARVTGLDISPEALEEATRLHGEGVNWLLGSVFEPPPELLLNCDGIIEHTCFCAIPPYRRKDYAQSVALCLKPHGLLVGVFWVELPLDDGPPYGSNPKALEVLFASVGLQRVYWQKADNSVESRQNEEWLGVFKAIG